ncbi:hypothetical protein HanPI659440_Chr10g0398341 [Helianthus annuus]|nr:hypothetical protein HanPI659440_Chr10g0398341 [Helianthus annuus]
MKVPVTSTMFTNLTCKLSLCVCVFRTECSQLSFCLSVCICLSHYTAWVYIYPAHDVWSKDPIDGPKDHLSSTFHSKDGQGPRKITFRGLSIRSISFEHLEGSTVSFEAILRCRQTYQTYVNCWPSQTRRIVDLVNLLTNFGHRLYTDRIQTKYRHKCTNKLPLGCSFVFIFYSCRLVSNFDGLWSSSYQNSDVLSSLQCRRIFKVFTS